MDENKDKKDELLKRPKTIRQIVEESHKKVVEPEKPTEPTESKEKEEDVEKKKEEERRKRREEREARRTKETEEVAKKAAEEAAKKATEETKKSFQEEITKILDKDKTLQDKQTEADELIASWEKENRLPKDYKELISETMRISDAKFAQREKERVERETKEREEKERVEKETKEKSEQEAKETERQRVEAFNKQISEDLNKLYEGKYLEKPEDINEINNADTKDEKAKQTQDLFNFGVELNTKLRDEGKQPVTSLTEIYFMHYKPYLDAKGTSKKEVAGADAPVAGGMNNATKTEKKMSYAQFHNESWAQLRKRIEAEYIS